jgi:hypothetical protein
MKITTGRRRDLSIACESAPASIRVPAMSSCSSSLSAASASQLSQSLVGQQISIGVAKLALNAQQQQGDAANQLLASAARLSQAIGKGSQFDAVA